MTCERAFEVACLPKFWMKVFMADFLPILPLSPIQIYKILEKVADHIREFTMTEGSYWTVNVYMVSELLGSFKNLVHLNLSGARNVQHINFVLQTPKLEEIILDDCSNLHHYSFRNDLIHCQNLKFFSMQHLYHFTKHDILAVTHLLPNLKYLNVLEMDHLPPDSVMAIFAYCHKLEAFYFSSYFFHRDVHQWIWLVRDEYKTKKFHKTTYGEISTYKAIFDMLDDYEQAALGIN